MVYKEKPSVAKEKPQLQEILCEFRPNNKNMSVLSAVEHCRLII